MNSEYINLGWRNKMVDYSIISINQLPDSWSSYFRNYSAHLWKLLQIRRFFKKNLSTNCSATCFE